MISCGNAYVNKTKSQVSVNKLLKTKLNHKTLHPVSIFVMKETYFVFIQGTFIDP